MTRVLTVVVALVLLLVPSAASQLRVAPPGERPDAVALELMLRKLSSTGTFMQTDAHPDDEDNGLLAMLGHGQGIRTTLVTLTRGDGGQNEIGPELGQPLGVLRTEELLAVHRFDGAEQYFTRAVDFGYSFSVKESIDKWGHDEILGDLVRHIRTIRPDVIAGFLCGGQAGGLHHQAAAELTREAFRAAADPAKYPEQIKDGLHPWQAVRYFCTDEHSFAPQPPPLTADTIVADISGFDSILGRTYAELGLEARSMHKCQGTSQLLLLPGQTQNRRYRIQEQAWAHTGVGGLPGPGYVAAPGTLLEGIDTSIVGLTRFVGDNKSRREAELHQRLRRIQQFVSDSRDHAASRGTRAAVGPLASGLRALRDLRRDLPDLLGPWAAVVPGPRLPTPGGARNEIDFRLAQKERQFQDALIVASGTRLDALADDGVVTQGQTVNVAVHAAGGGELTSATLSGFGGQLASCTGQLAQPVTCKATVKVPAKTPLSTPYWTPRTDAARYDFEPDVPFGVPFRPTPFRATFELAIGGEIVTIERPVEYRYSHVMAGEKRSEVIVAPAFNVTVDPEIAVFPVKAGAASGSSRKIIKVTVGNNQKGAASAAAALHLPPGWTSDPVSHPIAFTREDESVTVTFALRPPAGAGPGETTVNAAVTSGTGARSDLGYQVIEYPHVHRRHVVQPAAVRVKAVDVTVAANLRVGYVMGVGDLVPGAIEQLGAQVTLIDADTLASGDLSRFHTIVVGVRAYERRPDLRANNQRLLRFADNGGTVLVQYQKTEFNDAQYGPFPARTSSNRITDENAPMEILVPGHPVFAAPNRIGPEAWHGWLQERGTYFLGERDPRYVDLLRARDPFPYNADAKTGILVEARVGKGRWIYTGLGLWRQLPAGTEGAYRLLANLISLGKQ
jgi:LmbE family N-acetylglucosaminyl deacetylase